MTGHAAVFTARHSSMLAIVAVTATFAVAALAVALLRDGPPLTAEEEHAARVVLHPRLAPLRTRCETCGTIESIRFGDTAGAAPAFYEFTVRLPDGSLRRSRDPQPGRWKVGDQMQLLGGERTWNQGAPAASAD